MTRPEYTSVLHIWRRLGQDNLLILKYDVQADSCVLRFYSQGQITGVRVHTLHIGTSVGIYKFHPNVSCSDNPGFR